ncbi:hypothetical protein HIM_05992 [Hirsutella minnesotensis 3608]|uniref:Uncharacterized protein n=1 Tax=Hirsutella minnesotensis 3608 TaxID=1043627 RepID=A0A0F7ZZQ7_9HYPO|nr:hypothetical protein HIM_05992 [Hirsutella minnesotensis 3608]
MQGFNMGRYVPPEVEGTTTGNRLHGRRAPGAGPSPTVRFEMPFAVWCGTCPQPTLIGQGVRFNAEKRRVGSYHSTPVWAFCMRHADCGGAIEVRTDPQNTAYVVVAGGKRRDHGDDGDGEGPRQAALWIAPRGQTASKRRDQPAAVQGREGGRPETRRPRLGARLQVSRRPGSLSARFPRRRQACVFAASVAWSQEKTDRVDVKRRAAPR